MSGNRVWQGLILGVAVGLTAVAAIFAVRLLIHPTSPEEVAEAFFRAGYRHEYASAWDLVSSQDQAARSQEAYLSANSLPTDQQAALYEQLAAWGEFEVLAISSSRPDQAILTANVRFPNSAQSDVQDLLAAAGDSAASQTALLEELGALSDREALQFFEGDVSFNLGLEGNRWRVVQHWGSAVTVLLEAAVSPDLPWEFYPVQTEMLALPGELVKATYLARNNTDESITAKAVHEVGPAEYASYFQTVQCFCFTEQTLAPAEQREMVLLFRIDFTLPQGVREIRNRYTFYALESFPAEG